jgi:hypothetical protein
MSVEGGNAPEETPGEEPASGARRTREPFWDMKASHWAQALLAVAILCVSGAQLLVYRDQAATMSGQLTEMQSSSAITRAQLTANVAVQV